MRTPVRILVADDSDTMRRAICALLQAQTDIAVCGEAGNYAELLKIFNATTTDVVDGLADAGRKTFYRCDYQRPPSRFMLAGNVGVERRRDGQRSSVSTFFSPPW